jgi:hypothetical protein
MATQVLQFVELSDRERKRAAPLPQLARGDTLELRVQHRRGGHNSVPLPPRAAALVKTVVEHLMRGEKIAVLAEDREVSPNEAAAILGMSRPLVVHRMDVGDLPFRYVGKHRRAKLRDVLALKEKVDRQRAALEELAEETERLMRDHGL